MKKTLDVFVKIQLEINITDEETDTTSYVQRELDAINEIIAQNNLDSQPQIFPVVDSDILESYQQGLMDGRQEIEDLL